MTEQQKAKALDEFDTLEYQFSDDETDRVINLFSCDTVITIRQCLQPSMEDDLAEALEFYRDVSSYMASMYKDVAGFDYKNTPVHMDGGNKAREALAKYRERKK